eukprot:5377954-Pyramimonas_sp.AAC.1
MQDPQARRPRAGDSATRANVAGCTRLRAPRRVASEFAPAEVGFMARPGGFMVAPQGAYDSDRLGVSRTITVTSLLLSLATPRARTTSSTPCVLFNKYPSYPLDLLPRPRVKDVLEVLRE